MIKIVTLTYKTLIANTHLLFLDDEHVIIFDAGQDKGQLVSYLNEHKLTPTAVFLTHGHIDHIRGLEALNPNIPIYIHEEDERLLYEPKLNLSSEIPPLFILDRKVNVLKDNDYLCFNDITIKCIHTPFHTSGSACYLVNDSYLISGDTLFHLTIGRSDLPRSCPRFIDSSLRKLIDIKDDVGIYPGHGENSVMGIEKKKNIYLKNINK